MEQSLKMGLSKSLMLIFLLNFLFEQNATLRTKVTELEKALAIQRQQEQDNKEQVQETGKECLLLMNQEGTEPENGAL